ncbi:hypothetical protein N7468_001671 [Penicillium chermesinum]|uniref:ubiquitinyl hydrolase 1 n=1 Tax=Penicillium chermesinum TaxID=63820 RepID=A0A9W9PJ80_9EURO|nr:uncharacterized protein N7468_001671 [Penicillium chermesinum]KAJ5246688.1 hypothetical protein N7468_001671 [Penicillium chermesinum]
MNARQRVDIYSSGPIHYASQNSHDETLFSLLQNNQTIAYAGLAVFSIYILLDHFGFVPISLIQLSWDLLVFATPSWILVALDTRISPSGSYPSNPTDMSFAAKNEAMRRILGLDNSVFPFFRRSRSLSSLGGALLGNNKDTTPPGLGNWDNSCYQNSIIQGLASLKSFDRFLGRNLERLADKGPFSTHQALKGIIDHLNSGSNSGHKLWIPAELKSMSSWQQQDAQEYFSKLVDQIDVEVQQASRGQTRNMGLKMVGRDEDILKDINDDGEDDGSPNVVIKSSLRNPLEGLLAQRVGCMTCGWTEGLSLIPFNCLTVRLGGQFEYHVQECLDQYMTLEPIEGVECAKCTLLRAKDQLHNLLGDVSHVGSAHDGPKTPGLSDAVRKSALTRLEAVNTAIEEDDFAEKTLTEKCHISPKNRVPSTKSRQAVIARAPQSLVVHVNRSLFDEMTGMLKKNHAAVKFPKTLDLNDWCLGANAADRSGNSFEQWVMDPSESMLPQPAHAIRLPSRHYELRAIITHYGRHENGHYICYRKYQTDEFPASVPEEVLQAEGDKEKTERWFRLSDDDVQMVSEGHAMSQGGVFMLFYEAVDSPAPQIQDLPDPEPVAVDEPAGSVSNYTFSENMSTASAVTDAESDTSHATSVSAPDQGSPIPEEIKPIVPPISFGPIEAQPQHSPDEFGSPSMVAAQ